MKKNNKNIFIGIIVFLLFLVGLEAAWIIKKADSEKEEKSDEWDFEVDKQIAESFETALSDGSIEVWFQPICDPNTDKTVGGEGLSRWKDGENYISPGVFVPTLEATGQVRQLDKNVFIKACEFQKERLGKQELFPISVNLSALSATEEGVVEEYKEILDSCGLPKGCINIEVTESLDAESRMLADLVEDLHTAGFLVEIDDFGAGYSAYSDLVDIAYDILKIDKSIIDKIGTERGNEVASTIIDMAHRLGMSVIAEGVESKEQVDLLKEMKCDAIQGYYYSKPLSHDDFCNYLAGKAE